MCRERSSVSESGAKGFAVIFLHVDVLCAYVCTVMCNFVFAPAFYVPCSNIREVCIYHLLHFLCFKCHEGGGTHS